MCKICPDFLSIIHENSWVACYFLIIYGGNAEPVSIVLNHDNVNNAQVHDAFYNEVLTIVVAGKEEKVKVQAIQRHPTKPKLVHLDFKRA